MVRFGRNTSCHVTLQDKMVSRLHCVIRHINGQWILEDCQSRNKTFVNSLCITKTTLTPGDFIQIGDTAFSFLSSQKDPLAGRTIGGFFIQKKIGRGGMASVYLARQVSLARQVAVKLLASRFSGDDDFIQRFIREARSAARLNHPNIVQIYDSGCDHDYNYIAMEYLPGGTLADKLFHEGAMDHKPAVEIGLTALEAVAYAETMGLVHRDIKPGNLLFTADGRVKIADFGIALDLSDPAQLLEGLAAGSPAYMAPEQVRGQNVDTRADIYAVGATLYHTISGEKPCKGGTVKEMLVDKLKNDPVPLKTRTPAVPARLSQVVETMLARQPEDRFACADDAIKALEKALSSPARPRPHLNSLHKKKSRKKVSLPIVAVVLLVLAVLSGLGIYVFKQANSNKEKIDVARNEPGQPDLDKPKETGPDNPPANQPIKPVKDSQDGKQKSSNPKPKQPSTKKPLSKETVAEKTRAAEMTASAIQKLLDDDALIKAHDALQKFKKDSYSRKWTGTLQASLRQKSQTLYKAQESIIQAHLSLGRLAEAEEALSQLAQRLPSTERKLVSSLKQRIASVERKKRYAQRELPKLQEQVFKQLAGLNGTATLQLVDTIMQEKGILTPELSRLKQNISLMMQVCEGLKSKIRSLIQSRAATPLQFRDAATETGYTPASSCSIISMANHVLTVKTLANPRQTMMQPLFSMPPDLLLKLIGTVEGLTPQDISTALGFLAFLRCGPEAADAALAGMDPTHDICMCLNEMAPSLSKAWARMRFNELEADYAKADPAGTAPEKWDFWVREILALAPAYVNDHRQRDKERQLEKMFLAIRPKSLLTRPLAELCHAMEVKTASNGLTLFSYDFSTPRQVRDFDLITDADKGGRLAMDGKTLVLTGEMRFLRGEPFQTALSVTGKVARCESVAPNVNIVLWTAERDRLNPRFSSTDNDLSNFSGSSYRRHSSDYVVLGMGFYIQPKAGMSKIPLSLREPVYALLNGTRHGRSTGSNTSTLLWQTPSGRLPRSGFAFKAESFQGNLTWTINKRRLSLSKVPGIAIIKNAMSREGSLSIFTGTKTVAFSELKVTGMLREEWPVKEAHRRAEAEWKAASKPPAPPATSSTTDTGS